MPGVASKEGLQGHSSAAAASATTMTRANPEPCRPTRAAAAARITEVTPRAGLNAPSAATTKAAAATVLVRPTRERVARPLMRSSSRVANGRRIAATAIPRRPVSTAITVAGKGVRHGGDDPGWRGQHPAQ